MCSGYLSNLIHCGSLEQVFLPNRSLQPARQLLVKVIADGAQINSLLPGAHVVHLSLQSKRPPSGGPGTEWEGGRDQVAAAPCLPLCPRPPALPPSQFLYVSSVQMINRMEGSPPTRELPSSPLGRGEEMGPKRLVVCKEYPQQMAENDHWAVVGKPRSGSAPPLLMPCPPLSSPFGVRGSFLPP